MGLNNIFVSKIVFNVESKLPLFTVIFHITPCFILDISFISNLSFNDSSFARPKMSSCCRTRYDAVFLATFTLLINSLLELYNSPDLSILLNVTDFF